jgi:hypothetical protein
MPGTHARIAPSSLAIIVACHAHLQMAEPYKDDPPTPESLEGDAAHWVNLQWVTSHVMPAVGTFAPNGVPVDEDMQDGARLWRDTVGDYGHCETMVPIPRLHPTDCSGTPDFWRYDPIEEILWVWDYKYGHLFVDAFENWQEIAYLLGLLDFLGLDDTVVRIGMGVVQPRSYDASGTVRRWGPMLASDLRAYANRAKYAIDKSLQPNPEATAGTHCEFCPARHECKTLQHAAMAATMYTNAMDRVNLPPHAVATELRILDAAAALIDARRTGLQQQAEALIKSGKRVPGYVIEHAQGRLKWDKPLAEIFILGDMMGAELRKPQEAITPTQAVQRKLLDATLVNSYASRAPGAAKLTAESSTAARKVFGANAT